MVKGRTIKFQSAPDGLFEELVGVSQMIQELRSLAVWCGAEERIRTGGVDACEQ